MKKNTKVVCFALAATCSAISSAASFAGNHLGVAGCMAVAAVLHAVLAYRARPLHNYRNE